MLYVSNVGDSRVVLCIGNNSVQLSQDHNPTNPQETKRIRNAGGYISHKRVNGFLNLSRSLGDYSLKENNS